ncbi:MAG: D-alanine--D-alanine ligase [Clostridiales bacterium]|nr:D-alanine--D-alanine ligase [Clostridiales bacterium]
MKNDNASKVRVGLFFGGKSVEHEVSVVSALQAYNAFDTGKYDVITVYITKDGKMYTGGKTNDISAYKDIDGVVKSAQRVNLVNDGGRFYLVRYPSKTFGSDVVSEIDVAFPVVHGTNVEDGTLQGYFKTVGIPFAGCDVCASALGMDKAATKAVMKMNGIPVLDCVSVNVREYFDNKDEIIEKIEKNTRFPVIVKPVNLGSSVGVKKVSEHGELMSALDEAFMFSTTVLAENAVENLKEINCSVLGDKYEAVASVCEEPVNDEGILTYEDKYVSSGGKSGSKGAESSGTKSSGMANLKRKIPADISKELEEKVRDYSVKAFKAMGCSGVSRIDYLYDTVNEELYLNEFNTIPGSLAFYLWEATGIKFDELLDRLVKLAFKREREESGIFYSFETNILKGIELPKGTKN